MEYMEFLNSAGKRHEITERDALRAGFSAHIITDAGAWIGCDWSNRRKAWTVERQTANGFEFVKKLPTLAVFIRKYGERLAPSAFHTDAQYCANLHGQRNGENAYIYARAEVKH